MLKVDTGASATVLTPLSLIGANLSRLVWALGVTALLKVWLKPRAPAAAALSCATERLYSGFALASGRETDVVSVDANSSAGGGVDTAPFDSASTGAAGFSNTAGSRLSVD